MDDDMEADTIEIEDESAQPTESHPPVPDISPEQPAETTQSTPTDLQANSGTPPATSSLQTNNFSSLPASESSILAATESVMEKLAATDVSVACQMLKVTISTVLTYRDSGFSYFRHFVTSTTTSCVYQAIILRRIMSDNFGLLVLSNVTRD